MKGGMNQDKKMFSKRSSSFVPIKAGQLMFEDAKSDMLITLEDSSEDLKIS